MPSPASGGQIQVFTMNANGSGSKALTKGAETVAPAWSPDGTQIVCIRGNQGTLVTGKTGAIKQLTRPLRGLAFAADPDRERLGGRVVVRGRVVLGFRGRRADLRRLRRVHRRDDLDVDLFLVLPLDDDRRAGREAAAEDEVRERVLDQALDRAAQRPGTHRRV